MKRSSKGRAKGFFSRRAFIGNDFFGMMTSLEFWFIQSEEIRKKVPKKIILFTENPDLPGLVGPISTYLIVRVPSKGLWLINLRGYEENDVLYYPSYEGFLAVELRDFNFSVIQGILQSSIHGIERIKEFRIIKELPREIIEKREQEYYPRFTLDFAKKI